MRIKNYNNLIYFLNISIKKEKNSIANYFMIKYKKQLIVIVQYNIITQNNKKRILILNDEPDIGLVLKMVLENNGYIVDINDDLDLILK
jgi:PleD family two-component response regulator